MAVELDWFVGLKSVGLTVAMRFLDVFVNLVFFLSHQGLYTINSGLHGANGVTQFVVMLESGVERLVWFGVGIGSETRLVLVAVRVSD